MSALKRTLSNFIQNIKTMTESKRLDAMELKRKIDTEVALPSYFIVLLHLAADPSIHLYIYY